MSCDEIAVPFNPDPTFRRFLPRAGGEMLGPLRLADGEEFGPSLTWNADTQTGLWRDPVTGWVWWVQGGARARRMDEGSTFGFLATNDSGSTIQAGQPVRVHTDGTLRLAQADSLANAAIAIAMEQIAHAGSGTVSSTGLLTLADWTAVIGSATLTPSTRYYLTPSALGMLQSSAPTANPDVLQFCGVAVGSTTLKIEIESPIGL